MKEIYLNLSNRYPRLAKVFRYVISGGIATFVDFIFLYFFTDFLHIWYLLSAIVAFILAFFVSFFLQKYWTFGDDSSDRVHKQMIIYLSVAGTNLCVNTLLMYLFVHYVNLHYMVAQFIISGFIAISSFFIFREVVFKKKKIINIEEPGRVALE